MFKRVRWMGMGAVAGIGASAWVQRRLRQTLQEHPSIQVGADVVSTARRVGREVTAAVADGRRAMAEREAALRSELEGRREPAGGPTAGGPISGPAAGASPRRAPGPGRTPGRPRLHVVDATSSDPRPAARHHHGS